MFEGWASPVIIRSEKQSGLKDIDEARAASFLGFLGDFLRYVYDPGRP
jgi:hypothetical protein